MNEEQMDRKNGPASSAALPAPKRRFYIVKMRRRFKASYHKFTADRPGSRFLHLHQRSAREAQGPVIRGVWIVIGIVLIIGGLLLGLIPGVPGIVLGVLGFAVIAAQFKWAAKWCDQVEVWGRKIFKKLRHRHTHPRPSRMPK